MARKTKPKEQKDNDFSGMIVPLNQSAKAKPTSPKKKNTPKRQTDPFKTEIIGPYADEMNHMMDDLLQFIEQAVQDQLQSDSIKVEDVRKFKKEKDDYSEIDHIPYKDELYCIERIMKIFADNEIEFEKFSPNLLIAQLESNGKLLIKNSSRAEIIRFEIPLIFKSKVTKAKKLEFLNQLNNEIAMIRFLLEDEGIGMACLEYHYGSGLFISHFLYFMEVIEGIVFDIYSDYENVLDLNAVGIIFDE